MKDNKVIKETIDLMERMDNLNKDNMVFEVYEPQGTYNGARYISFEITEDKTILKEEIDWVVPDDEKGGIISLSTDVNAEKLDNNKFLNAIKQFVLTWKQRLTYGNTIDKVAQKHNLIGWTIGRFLKGRYTGKNGKVWSENSLTIEIVGITSDKLIEIAKDLCAEFRQESVLVKDYSNNKILFVNSK